MNDKADHDQTALAISLRTLLLELARREETLAQSQAAGAPYWAPNPTSVIGHRAAAEALRSEAERFLEAS